MKKRNCKKLYVSVCALTLFILWTVLVCVADVRAIGPQGSSVGFSSLNEAAHRLTGVNMSLYIVTDWLGLVPFAVAAGFALLGFVQMIKRKSIARVDRDILALGGFYIAVVAAYLFFEAVTINYRPILIDGRLEASYPSSTTMLTLCVMPSAMMQLRKRIGNAFLGRCIAVTMGLFTAFMVIGRLISGVHWVTDIIGGILLSVGLVMAYGYACGRIANAEDEMSDQVKDA